MGFFSRRRKRENAIPETTDAALGSFASAEGQPVVGKQVGGGQPGMNVQGLSAADGLAMLTQLGPMIQQAMATGNVQVSQSQPQVIDMRGTGLREEIIGIMGQHGINPTAGTANQNVNAGAYGDMQKQIAEALAKHGVNASPAAANLADYAQMQKEIMEVIEKHGFHPSTGLQSRLRAAAAPASPRRPGLVGSAAQFGRHRPRSVRIHRRERLLGHLQRVGAPRAARP